ncbi:hypothetical protein BpHYR1_012597 [Brachionus plicatilis]|uniref:Uncharacterized protein n=1 Tax=Brachionus plicatilis TaxID=10195 RepID=A0A3M7T264_BRAPC|nr:hypothetical protein BpHYR1_012597 [Brachionus plicatilis]
MSACDNLNLRRNMKFKNLILNLKSSSLKNHISFEFRLALIRNSFICKIRHSDVFLRSLPPFQYFQYKFRGSISDSKFLQFSFPHVLIAFYLQNTHIFGSPKK